MQTTYQHLNDDDHIEAAEVAAGIREPESDTPLTPQVCPTCSEPLSEGDRACSACGTVFAPDAKEVEDQVESNLKDSYKQTDPEDTDTQEKLDTLDDLLDDPEIKNALLSKLGET